MTYPVFLVLGGVQNWGPKQLKNNGGLVIEPGDQLLYSCVRLPGCAWTVALIIVAVICIR